MQDYAALSNGKQMMMDNILEQASARQNVAADSTHSVWVSASAGTGKTYVLTKRILQLLIKDPTLKPRQILAVTFTRAAAREMQNRLLKRVSTWEKLSDDALKSDIFTIVDANVTQQHLERARTLFAVMLDDGVHMNTLHGFCQHILARFPLEAGLEPHFQLIDEQESKQMLAQAKTDVYRQALEGCLAPDWVFPTLAHHFTEGKMTDVLTDFVRQASKFRKLKRQHKTVEGAAQAAADFLEVPFDITVDQGIKPHLKRFEAVVREALACYHDCEYKRVQNMCAALQEFLQKPYSVSSFISAVKIPLNADGDGYRIGWLFGKKVRDVDVDMYDILVANCQRVLNAYYGLTCARLTHGYLHLGFSVLERYEQIKYQAARVDFDDLIRLTEHVMRSEKKWLHFKLDSQIRHVLLDEAQDTDREQWYILKTIIDEFYAGDGQHDQPRTFFAVGDVKQSIYRFRGAEPDVFGEMKHYLADQKSPTAVANMGHSFRSTTAILEAVDHVFSTPEYRMSVDAFSQQIHHEAVQENSGGKAVIWPAQVVENKGDFKREPWTLPTAPVAVDTPRRAVARKIAMHIHTLLNDSIVLHTTKKPVKPGDIMILVRTRTMQPELIAALDEAGLPHGGADTVAFLSDLAVLDLIALMKWRVNPADKMSYFHVLKSPLVGWSDSDILSNKSTPKQLLISPDLSAYDFLSRALQQLPVVRTEGVTYLLEEALEITRAGQGNLTGFIHQLQDQIFKKEQEPSGNKIRLMTTHSAKGLEAPIVFLADSGRNFYQNLPKESVLWGDDLCLVRLKKGARPAGQIILEKKEKERLLSDEMRLLYVAMTRAKDQLYIAAESYPEKEAQNCAHGLILKAVDGIWREENDGSLVWEKPVKIAAEKASKNLAEPTEVSLPNWCLKPAAFERGVVPLNPSEKAIETHMLANSAVHAKFAYGDMMHRLLEILPTYPKRIQMDKGRHYLEQKGIPQNQIETMLLQVKNVFEKNIKLFGEMSRAEVPVMYLKNGHKMDGVIDRLVVMENEVWIVDYKTSDPGNATRYQKQLQSYVRALAEIYPDRQIKAGILWTKTAALEWVISRG